MLGKQSNHSDQPQLVTVEALVPPKHVLRRLHAALDLAFVREKVASLYSRFGRPSVAPELVVRMWILQHFYGFSERQLCDELAMHAGFRWFCGLSFADPVPDQSTLVKLRTEKWEGSGLWEEVLAETVRLCEAAGICRPGAGQRLGIDGTQIDANAATVSLEEVSSELTVVEGGLPVGEENNPAQMAGQPSPPAAPASPAPELRLEVGGRKHDAHRSGDPDWHGERFSNATHRSTTDPEARLYRKSSGQEAQLRYLGHYLADLPSGVIYGAMATQATGTAEREAALTLLDGLAKMPEELAADLGYRDGDFLAAVLSRGVQPLVPLQDEALETEPSWQRGTTNPAWQQQRAARLAAARARNATRQAARGRRGAVAQRQRTRLEHLIGEGKEHHGLRRAHGRGLTRVDQQIKLTASVQNLKRWTRARPWRREAALPVAATQDAGASLAVVGPGGPTLQAKSARRRRRQPPGSHRAPHMPDSLWTRRETH